MVALTYGDTRVAAPESKIATKTAAPRQHWFTRFLAAMMESRMRQAEREIRLYASAFPPVQYEPAELPFNAADGNTPRGGW